MTWNSAAVGCVYHELHVSPPLSVTTAPWSATSSMMSGLIGFHQMFWLSSPPGAPLNGTNVRPPSVDL
jgi:hypothetical protein